MRVARGSLEEARRRLGVPALAFGTVTTDGLQQVEVVGVRRRGGHDPARVEDRWHIGSCGKALTAALWAKLVEQGLAEWGYPIRQLFPDLQRTIHRSWSGPTVDDLFLCRSGAPANPPRTLLRRDANEFLGTTNLVGQRTALVERTLRKPPDRPGHFRYSNLGYIVAGAAIERITNLPFEQALVEHLLRPLGVRGSGFGAPPSLLGHGPKFGFRGLCLGKGAPVPEVDPGSDNPPFLSPAGRLHLTLADWARTHLLFLQPGHELLATASVEHLLHVPAGSPMAMGWAPTRGQPGLAFGMQGSNLRWVATALMDEHRRRTALLVVNDGRTRLLARIPKLLASLTIEA